MTIKICTLFLNKGVINLFLFLKQITLRQHACRSRDRKTLMKINLSDNWNAHLALRYFISRAIVLYVALLITRWFLKMRKEDIKHEKERK